MKQISKENWILRELLPLELLECERRSRELLQELLGGDFDPELAELLCEHGALCSMALICAGKPVFLTARDALEGLTIDELAQFYDTYFRHFTTEEERAVNESFPLAEGGSPACS